MAQNLIKRHVKEILLGKNVGKVNKEKMPFQQAAKSRAIHVRAMLW